MKLPWKSLKYILVVLYLTIVLMPFLLYNYFKGNETFKTFIIICYSFGFTLLFILALYEFFQYLRRKEKFQEKKITKIESTVNPKCILTILYGMLISSLPLLLDTYFKGNETFKTFALICYGLLFVWLTTWALYELSRYLRREKGEVSGEKI
jgi:hypothetical protein